MKETARRAGGDRDALLRDLCDVAREGGAEDAVIVSAGDVIIDPRVRLKCMISPCYLSGTCGHCPPHGDSIEEVRSSVAAYEKGVYFRVAADQGYLSGPNLAHCIENGSFDDEGAVIMSGTYYIICFQIVALMEKKARQRGYEPLGFGAGGCKGVFCLYEQGCRALKDRARCRHPDLSRPSMEASGMDVFAMAANVGWEVYPLGGDSRPGDAPRGSLHGLVLVS